MISICILLAGLDVMANLEIVPMFSMFFFKIHGSKSCTLKLFKWQAINNFIKLFIPYFHNFSRT